MPCECWKSSRSEIRAPVSPEHRTRWRGDILHRKDQNCCKTLKVPNTVSPNQEQQVLPKKCICINWGNELLGSDCAGVAVPTLCAPWGCAGPGAWRGNAAPAVTALQEQGFAQRCYGADAIQSWPRCSVLSVVKQQMTADTVRASLLMGSQESKG